MVNATVRAVDGDVLVLTIGSEPLARRLSEQRNTDVIADALHAVLGVRWRVRCDHGDAAPPPARPAASRTSAPPQRPSRPAPSRPAPTRRSAPDDGEPLPPEPPDEEAPPEDEEAMMAEAAADAAAPTVRRDPEEVAIELLSAQLGATAIERADPSSAILVGVARRDPVIELTSPAGCQHSRGATLAVIRRLVIRSTVAPRLSSQPRRDARGDHDPRNRRIPSAIAAA